MQWLETLFSAVVTVVVGIVGYYGTLVLKEFVSYVKVKLHSSMVNSAKELAYGLYIYLEELYEDQPKSGEFKRNDMEAYLLEKFPNLTDVDLTAINKEVWYKFNTTNTNSSNNTKLHG